MTRKFLLACASLLFLSTAILCQAARAYEPPQSARTKFNFNAGWLVKMADEKGAETPGFADADWKKVTLPYAWNEDSAFKVLQSHVPTGIAWYRKRFTLPASSAGKKVFVEFEGIRQAGEFYLNGEWIGRSENGVMAFGFDITDKVTPGENVLAARIDNDFGYKEKETGTPFQWNTEKRFYANYGGINKNVFLHVTDRLHQTLPLFSNLGTTGVYVHASSFDIPGKSATVSAESQVKNEQPQPRTVSYQVVIEDRDGKVVKTIDGEQSTLAAGETKTVKASARVDGLNWWSWGYGYLYNVYTILRVNNQPVDVVKTRTGFRKLEFGRGMVRLNDRTIHLKGYAQRSTNEWPAVGSAVPTWMSDLSNRLMVENNANLVRWMHVAPGKQEIESCDRVGLLQALPAGDAEQDAKGRQWKQRVELMRDVTIYNRNNPSVVMWESGNEGITEAHMAEMNAVRDQYDPHGGRASGCREMLDSKEAEWGGEMLYINKSARTPFWATEYSRDEGLRRYWDELTPPYHKDGEGPKGPSGEGPKAYNRNQDSHAVENVVRWAEYWAARPGTGERVNAGGVNIYFSDSQTHPRGAANYRCSGEVDAMRLPKEGFYAHQVMWDGWVNVEKPRAHIVGHWNYAPTVKKPIYVVSSADKVELFINGQSKGFGAQSHTFLFTWKDVQFAPGSIKAVGYDAKGAKLCEAEKKTAGNAVALKLTPRTKPGGLNADGSDMALVDIEVVDAQGNRCPTALNLIKFDLQGPAEWRGGIAAGPVDRQTLTISENFILSKELPVECGINRVILRSQPQAGTITLTATAEGLKPATLALASKPVQVTDGLSPLLPDAGLPAYLERGPTPTGESFQMTRTPLKIAGVKAGANADKAALTFDDNETTLWSNDDNRATGWIQYELAEPATVGELTFKMGGWRSKSYPVRITVDGAEVFNGTTPQSLGYVTIFVKPTKGKNVGIELIGSAVNRDAFGAIVEVENQANAATVGGDNTAKGSLAIVEAEIYAPVGPITTPTATTETRPPARATPAATRELVKPTANATE